MSRPTLGNWTQHPGSIWSFRHLRELIPTARVPARAPKPLREELDPDLYKVPFDDPSGRSWVLESYLEQSHTDAFVVLHKGVLVLEWYGPGGLPDDRHTVFSVTKSITGLLVGALAKRGKLDLTGDVVDYVPEAEGSGYGDTTLRHLLDMLANVRFDEDHTGGAEIMKRYRRATNWLPGAGDEGLHEFICSLPSEGNHGERFRYLSPGMDLLGWVCERAAGEPFAEALSRYLWTPMGAESDAEITVDRDGAARAAGGLSITARDMSRVGQLLVDGGGDALAADFVDDLFAGGDRAAWADGDFADYFPGGAFRSGWYDPGTQPGVIGAFGSYMQVLLVDRPRQTVVVKQSSWPSADCEASDHATIAAGAAIGRSLVDVRQGAC
jgi:CubicO group peptidase (beta-lactamase class C family)